MNHLSLLGIFDQFLPFDALVFFWPLLNFSTVDVIPNVNVKSFSFKKSNKMQDVIIFQIISDVH